MTTATTGQNHNLVFTTMVCEGRVADKPSLQTTEPKTTEPKTERTTEPYPDLIVVVTVGMSAFTISTEGDDEVIVSIVTWEQGALRENRKDERYTKQDVLGLILGHGPKHRWTLNGVGCEATLQVRRDTGWFRDAISITLQTDAGDRADVTLPLDYILGRLA